MTTRRNFVRTTSLAGLTAAFGATLGATSTWAAAPRAGAAAARTPLRWQHFLADEQGFSRAPVLLSGQRDAVLIDGGFTLSDGKALADAIRTSGKRLTTIYVSQSDPDYYFGLAPVRAAFPQARVLAASDTLRAIHANVEKKLATWGPQLKDNGPQKLADVVMPQAFDGPSLELEGHRIEIVPADGLPNRRYLWVPSLQAIFGGVMVFSGLHVWTADTPTPASRSAWAHTLDQMLARQPAIVVPGHMAQGAPMGAAALTYTRDYLHTFEREAAKAPDSKALIAAMQQRYPHMGSPMSLELSAKVAKGEMQWG